MVDFDGSGSRVVWSFRGKRGSDVSRTESFVADCTAPPDADLFESFAGALRLADEAIRIPPEGDLQSRLGLDICQVSPGTPGLSAEQRERLWERLDGEAPMGADRPLVFGGESYRAALEAVRAIQDAGLECRVAVATGGEPASLDVDLVLVVGAEAEFTPLSAETASVLGVDEVGTVSTTRTDESQRSSRDESRATQSSVGTSTLPVALAVAVVLLYLGGVVVLLRGGATPGPVTDETVVGLVAMGLVLGSERVAGAQPWLGIVVLVVVAIVGVAGGAGALLHQTNIAPNGRLAVRVVGGYLGVPASFGLYTAGTTIVAGASGVLSSLRTVLAPWSVDHGD